MCVYKRVSPLWFVLNLKPESDDQWLRLFPCCQLLTFSLISELLSQGEASRVEIGGGAEEKLARSLAVYLTASLTGCI